MMSAAVMEARSRQLGLQHGNSVGRNVQHITMVI